MMRTHDEQISSGGDIRKILLVGDISKAFLDTDSITNKNCEVHASMLDAIDVAAKNNFAAIGVVMAGIPAKLSSALKALREVSSDAKIILLAQMYEEPIARQLVSSTSNGTSVADDYLICPVHANRLHECTVSIQGPAQIETTPPSTIDSTLETKIKQLEKLATEDDLTGLKNRRYIWEFSRQIIEHVKKENGRVTLLVFDIDNFKHYNDLYGHSAGDKILKQTAALIRRCCRAHDVVGRIGGDEFAVIFWHDPQRDTTSDEAERRSAMADHPTEAIFISKRFRKEFEKAELGSSFTKENELSTGSQTPLHLLGPKGKGVLTISGGLASFPRDGSKIQELFLRADMALLDAKRSGKNRIYLVGAPQSDIADIE